MQHQLNNYANSVLFYEVSSADFAYANQRKLGRHKRYHIVLYEDENQQYALVNERFTHHRPPCIGLLVSDVKKAFKALSEVPGRYFYEAGPAGYLQLDLNAVLMEDGQCVYLIPESQKDSFYMQDFVLLDTEAVHV